MTDQPDDGEADDRHEERGSEEAGDEPNQYGGGDTEIDPVEQTERAADEGDEADEGDGEDDSRADDA